MNLLFHFQNYFQQNQVLQPGDVLLLAVSGGVDSIVLCELCKQAGFPFVMAHCNFNLRGEESQRDEKFVRQLGEKYGVDVVVQSFETNTFATENKLAIQEAARTLRYGWFTRLRLENNFAYTVLAHHADDNIETLLMNFFRGTGLHGLTGIPESNFRKTRLLRPMLSFRRYEIEIFAKKNQLAWVEDSSNTSLKYTRNYFRNQLIPELKKVFPQVEESLLHSIDRFKKIDALYQAGVEQLKKKLCEQHLNELRIPVNKLLKYNHTSILYEITKEYGFGEKQVREINKLLDAASGRFIENDHYQVIRHRNWLIIAPKAVETETVAIEKDQVRISSSGGILDLEFVSQQRFALNRSATTAQLDAKHIEFPLLLRKWRQGDYFYPLGLQKKKKLARFFIDQKIPKNQKENTWVLESNKKIIWVVGMRIDDRFKITSSTKEVLQLNWTSL